MMHASAVTAHMMIVPLNDENVRFGIKRAAMAEGKRDQTILFTVLFIACYKIPIYDPFWKFQFSVIFWHSVYYLHFLIGRLIYMSGNNIWSYIKMSPFLPFKNSHKLKWAMGWFANLQPMFRPTPVIRGLKMVVRIKKNRFY